MINTGMTRRESMIATGGLAVAGLIGTKQDSVDDKSVLVVSKKIAIARLKLGNARFVEGKQKHFREGRAWRENLVAGQNPFAIIIGCADSRVPTEMVFDQGFGDLFVIRNAGNVLMEDVQGSIEYAATHLHTKLVVVLGHEGCGAVTAALKSREERAKEPPELQQVLSFIDPAIANTNPQDKDAVAKGVEANVRWSVENIVRVQKERQRNNDFSVVGAVYELKTGRVRFLDQPHSDRKQK